MAGSRAQCLDSADQEKEKKARQTLGPSGLVFAVPVLLFFLDRTMQTQATKSLRPSQAAAFLGIAVPTLWRWLKERPDFPRSRKIGPRCTVFDSGELAQWRDSQTKQG